VQRDFSPYPDATNHVKALKANSTLIFRDLFTVLRDVGLIQSRMRFYLNSHADEAQILH